MFEARRPKKHYGSLTEDDVADLYDELKHWQAEERAAAAQKAD